MVSISPECCVLVSAVMCFLLPPLLLFISVLFTGLDRQKKRPVSQQPTETHHGPCNFPAPPEPVPVLVVMVAEGGVDATTVQKCNIIDVILARTRLLRRRIHLGGKNPDGAAESLNT